MNSNNRQLILRMLKEANSQIYMMEGVGLRGIGKIVIDKAREAEQND